MQCPSCKKSSLKPAKLEDGLPGYTCSECEGFLIDILSYRQWIESKPEAQQSKKSKIENVEDSRNAILCPKCSKIMTKYRMSGEVANKLDLCNDCGEIWLDGGEWQMLEQLDLASKIPQILSEPWQRSVRKEQLGQPVEKKFEATVGAVDYQKISEFRNWMLSHEKASEILNYLARPGDNC